MKAMKRIICSSSEDEDEDNRRSSFTSTSKIHKDNILNGILKTTPVFSAYHGSGLRRLIDSDDDDDDEVDNQNVLSNIISAKTNTYTGEKSSCVSLKLSPVLETKSTVVVNKIRKKSTLTIGEMLKKDDNTNDFMMQINQPRDVSDSSDSDENDDAYVNMAKHQYQNDDWEMSDARPVPRKPDKAPRVHIERNTGTSGIYSQEKETKPREKFLRDRSSESSPGAASTDRTAPLPCDAVEEDSELNRLDERPTLSDPDTRAKEAIILEGKGDLGDSLIPAPAARYLKDYQVDGVKWLWEKYCNTSGCILADDMGLGKTVQLTCFLLAVFKKTGLASIDNNRNKMRRKYGATIASENATLGLSSGASTSAVSEAPSEWWDRGPPCLVVCPSSMVDMWPRELVRWGYFRVERLDKTTADTTIQLMTASKTDVVVCTYHNLEKYKDSLATIPWRVVAFDEGHMLKNEKSNKTIAAFGLSRAKFRVILTGTPMQNNTEEYWTLVSIITNRAFHSKKDFKAHFSVPIKKSHSTSASEEAKEMGELRLDEFRKIIAKYVLRREKSVVLADELPGKDDVVVFCEMSPLQTKLYCHVLSLPEFDNAKYMACKCPCGSTLQRSLCCEQFKVPLVRRGPDKGDIDKRAVIWRRGHPDDLPCEKCPSCVSLPCIGQLIKIASHPNLLQGQPSAPMRGDPDEEQDRRVIQFANEALSDNLLKEMGGCRRSSNILESSRIDLSGKMGTLHKLLTVFTRKCEKSLVFSNSTKMLDIIETYMLSTGWKFLRIDGSTASHQRQPLIDKFNKNKSYLVFLLSTKAAGVGITLNSASKVIIFDVNWNPALDKQAQDRAYRIGQKQHVSVYRLVAQGTVEELCYMRQLYKQSIQAACEGEAGERQFEGVEGDKTCRGELFGLENLFQHEVGGSILGKLRQKYAVVSSTANENALTQTASAKGLPSLDIVSICEKEALQVMVEAQGALQQQQQQQQQQQHRGGTGDAGESGGDRGVDQDSWAVLQAIRVTEAHPNDDLLRPVVAQPLSVPSPSGCLALVPPIITSLTSADSSLSGLSSAAAITTESDVATIQQKEAEVPSSTVLRSLTSSSGPAQPAVSALPVRRKLPPLLLSPGKRLKSQDSVEKIKVYAPSY